MIGYKNALQMFQRMMEDVLFSGENEDLHEFYSVYIDDIIIATPGDDFNECLEEREWRVRPVLEILKKNKLVCGPKKQKMFLERVKFCGSVLHDRTRTPAQARRPPSSCGSSLRPSPSCVPFQGLAITITHSSPCTQSMQGPLQND